MFQNFDGVARAASVVATNAQILPTLGRNLGQCGMAATCNATVIVELIEPNTVREPRQSQLDIRLSSNVRVGRFQLQPKFDVYNVLKANDVQSMVTRWSAPSGGAWLNASTILPARTFKFGVRAEF